MTSEKEIEIRARYQKNFLQILTLTPESVEDEYPELVAAVKKNRRKAKIMRKSDADFLCAMASLIYEPAPL
jgi:hypothetical protein